MKIDGIRAPIDDAEHRFRALFAQRVEGSARGGLQSMRHRLDRRRLFRRLRRRREALAERRVMRLAAIAITGVTPALSQAATLNRAATSRATPSF